MYKKITFKIPLVIKKFFNVNSVCGQVTITHHANIEIFGDKIGKIKFYILPELTTFDGIIGNDTLRQFNAIIYTEKNYFTLKEFKFPLHQLESQSVNKLDLRVTHISPDQNFRLIKIIKSCPTLFSNPNAKLTFTTNVVGEIQTSINEPVYAKSYPYPMALKSEIDKQITELLNDGIIRPSKSPYNSPLWIVSKKIYPKGILRKYLQKELKTLILIILGYYLKDHWIMKKRP